MILLAVSISAQAATRAWKSISTEHFTLTGDADEAILQRLAVHLEKLRAAVEIALPVLTDRNQCAVFVVFNDSAEYRAFKPKHTDGSIDDAVHGYFLSGEDRNFITLSADPASQPLTTISHEYIHSVLRANFPKSILPPWLNEGLAEYFETAAEDGDLRMRLGEMPPLRSAAFKRIVRTPLAGVLLKDSPDLHGTDLQRDDFYARSWAVVHVLMDSDRKGEKIAHLLQGLGRTSEPDLSSIFGLTLDDLAQGVLSLARNVPNTAIKIPYVDDARIARSAAVSGAEEDALLGDLLLHLGRKDEAEAMLRRALSGKERPLTAESALGRMLAEQGRFDAASVLLESAVRRGAADHLTNFYYAYSLDRLAADKNGSIGGLESEVAARMRRSLLKSIETAPDFVESYRLLAFLDLLDDESIPEAESLLRKALALKPTDTGLRILLAKVLLRQEKYSAAAAMASDLRSDKDKQISADAAEILSTVDQYRSATINFVMQPRSPWRSDMVFLKREWLTNADLVQIERDRDVNNLNIMLGHLQPGEARVLAALRQARCTSGHVEYDVVTPDGKAMTFTSNDFQNVRLSVLLQGSHSYRIDCGVGYPADRAVFTYKSPAADAADAKPQLAGIAFVPDYFRLKSLAEVVSFRTVVVEGDLGSDPGERLAEPDAKPEVRAARVRRELTPVGSAEKRVVGTLVNIDCQGEEATFSVSAANTIFSLHSQKPSGIKIRWFSVADSQVPLTCGSSPNVDNVAFTFNDKDQEVRSIEFLPDGLRLPPS